MIFELICQYCNYSWSINFTPKEPINCVKCNDTNIRAIRLSDKIDYYVGCPPFKEKDLDTHYYF